MKNGKTARVIIFALVLALAGGSAPVFSQQITALFGFGYHATDAEVQVVDSGNAAIAPAIAIWTNVLFIGQSGFTVSLGYDQRYVYDPELYDSPAMRGYSDIPIGFGYVKQDFVTEGAYFGGLLSFLPRLGIQYEVENFFDYTGDDMTGDIFLAPTLVAGYDFGFITAGAQLMYMRGMFSGYNGFKFFLGAGVTFDLGSGNSAVVDASTAADAEEYYADDDGYEEEEAEPEPEPEPRTTRRR